MIYRPHQHNIGHFNGDEYFQLSVPVTYLSKQFTPLTILSI